MVVLSSGNDVSGSPKHVLGSGLCWRSNASFNEFHAQKTMHSTMRFMTEYKKPVEEQQKDTLIQMHKLDLGSSSLKTRNILQAIVNDFAAPTYNKLIDTRFNVEAAVFSQYGSNLMSNNFNCCPTSWTTVAICWAFLRTFERQFSALFLQSSIGNDHFKYEPVQCVSKELLEIFDDSTLCSSAKKLRLAIETTHFWHEMAKKGFCLNSAAKSKL